MKFSFVQLLQQGVAMDVGKNKSMTFSMEWMMTKCSQIVQLAQLAINFFDDSHDEKVNSYQIGSQGYVAEVHID